MVIWRQGSKPAITDHILGTNLPPVCLGLNCIVFLVCAYKGSINKQKGRYILIPDVYQNMLLMICTFGCFNIIIKDFPAVTTVLRERSNSSPMHFSVMMILRQRWENDDKFPALSIRWWIWGLIWDLWAFYQFAFPNKKKFVDVDDDGWKNDDDGWNNDDDGWNNERQWLTQTQPGGNW